MSHEQFTRGDLACNRGVTLFCRRDMSPQFKLIWIQGTCRGDKISSPQQDFSWKSSVHTMGFVAGTKSPRHVPATCPLVWADLYTEMIFRATSYHCKLALQVDQCNTTFTNQVMLFICCSCHTTTPRVPLYILLQIKYCDVNNNIWCHSKVFYFLWNLQVLNCWRFGCWCILWVCTVPEFVFRGYTMWGQAHICKHLLGFAGRCMTYGDRAPPCQSLSIQSSAVRQTKWYLVLFVNECTMFMWCFKAVECICILYANICIPVGRKWNGYKEGSPTCMLHRCVAIWRETFLVFSQAHIPVLWKFKIYNIISFVYSGIVLPPGSTDWQYMFNCWWSQIYVLFIVCNMLTN